MLSSFGELFNLTQTVLLKGGWIVLVYALYEMFKVLYLDYINERWYKEQHWVFLKITVPRENEKSPLTFEQIMNHMHATHGTRSFAETYLEGQFQIWFTWELTSIGGEIGNYVRILEKHRDTLEAAVYSQFPAAEITAADDYFESLPKYHTDHSPYDVFSMSFVLKNQSYYPIRTYLDFEHSTAETFVDPVAGIWEELSKISPYEMVVMQYIFRPIDASWTYGGYQLIKKLKGEPGANKEPRDKIVDLISGFLGMLIDPFMPRGEPAKTKTKEEAPSLMLHLSEGEKAKISSVERKLSKLAYQVKMRYLYIAPREKYSYTPNSTAIVGALKSHWHTDLNSLKPDTDHWTRIRYWLFKKWEQPIHDLRLKYRKRRHMHMIRTRWYFHGRPPFILNTEEIASLLHFPGIEVTVPHIDKVQVTKIQPPPELPVVN